MSTISITQLSTLDLQESGSFRGKAERGTFLVESGGAKDNCAWGVPSRRSCSRSGSLTSGLEACQCSGEEGGQRCANHPWELGKVLTLRSPYFAEFSQPFLAQVKPWQYSSFHTSDLIIRSQEK